MNLFFTFLLACVNGSSESDSAPNTNDTNTNDTSAPEQITIYKDEDGDTYVCADENDPTNTKAISKLINKGDAIPEGWTDKLSEVLDCNDDPANGGASVNPNEQEIPYDGVDQDCSGADLTDADGDGYDAMVRNPNGDDCDDEDSAVNPGAEEVCNDGQDNNCNGSDDGCVATGAHSLAEADAALTGEAAGDRAGVPDGVGDVNGDGFNDIVVGAYAQGTNDAGAAYIKYGPFTGTTSLSVADSRWYGENSNDRAGIAVTGVGDVNGDGRNDVAVGAYYQGSNGTSAGAVYLIKTSSLGTNSLANATAKLEGESEYNFAGYAVAPAGDQDGDGLADFLVSSGGYDGGAFGHGAVYLIGDVSGTHSLGEVTKAKIVGNDTSDGAGVSMSSGGDVNADGVPDIIIGANDQQELFYGPISGSYMMSDGNTNFLGIDIGGESTMGDLDGDGYDDIVIGAAGNDDVAHSSGATYIVYGPPPNGDFSVTSADAIIRGAYEGQVAGGSVAIVDLDGNGTADVVVGASDGYSDAHHGIGNAYVFYNPVYGALSVNDADLSLAGIENGNLAGGFVANAKDVNNDGVEDLLISATGTVVNGYGNTGANYIKFGSGF